MELTESKIFEAFGLGAKEQAPATPAPEATTVSDQEGVNGQGVAAPAQEGNSPAPTVEQQAAVAAESTQDAQVSQIGTDTGEGANAAQAAQTEQQRRENASRRRKAEEQARINEAVERAVQAERDRSKADMDAFFAKAQLKNTLTGEPITTMEQFNAWNEAFSADKLSRELAAGKLTPESLNKAIEDNPVVKKAKEIVARDEQAAKQQKQAEEQEKIQADLLEIQKHDPTIQEVKDFLKMPNFLEFKAYVDKGYTYADAYYLANRERINNAAAEAARQQAMNNARSKDHLAATSIRGSGAESVPADEMALYRLFNPGASDADIQAHYNALKRKSK